MDKTIEVVLVAVVVIATAAIMLFIFSGESGSFSDFISNSISDANDTLEDTRNDESSATQESSFAQKKDFEKVKRISLNLDSSNQLTPI